MTKRCPTCQRESIVVDATTSSGNFSFHATFTGLSMEFPTAKRLPWRGLFGILILIGVWQTIAVYICTNLFHLTTTTIDSIRHLIAGGFFFFGCCGAYQRNVASKRANFSANNEICATCGQALSENL